MKNLFPVFKNVHEYINSFDHDVDFIAIVAQADTVSIMVWDPKDPNGVFLRSQDLGFTLPTKQEFSFRVQASDILDEFTIDIRKQKLI